MMRVALAQMEVIPGKPRENLETMLRMTRTAKQNDVDLIAFPELCIPGYMIGDKWNVDDVDRYFMEFDEELRKASSNIAIAYGNIFLDNRINERVGDSKPHPNKDGRTRKYNAVRVFQDGKPVRRARETNILPLGTQPKTLLPNYRFFDDQRYFFSLDDIAKDFGTTLQDLAQPFLIDVKGKKVPVGFEVCEDLWCEDYRMNGEPINITKHLINNGAQYIVNISASPWTFGKHRSRDKRIEFLKEESGEKFAPFLYVNCTGAQNNSKNIITFDGGSTAYNKEGKPVVFGNDEYKEELIIIDDEDLHNAGKERVERPKEAQIIDALETGIMHERVMLGKESHPLFVIGASGGVDSSFVAALATHAVGKDNVLLVNMPSEYNSERTKSIAEQLAKNLEVRYEVAPIGGIVEANEKALNELFAKIDGRPINSITLENIQAKIRGTSILSNIAGNYHALMTNNGNKVEVTFNYATLYGDVNGALAVIADCTKAEVYDCARYMNEHIFKREVIPNELLLDDHYRDTPDKVFPSAELKENQKDPLKFGYHDALITGFLDFKRKSVEDFMRMYIDGTLHEYVGAAQGKSSQWGLEMLQQYHMDKPVGFIKDLEWIQSELARSYKRKMAPPIIVVSKSAYGEDEREAILPAIITNEQLRLKERILQMNEYEVKM